MAALSWLALMVGNSRLHWAWFVGSTLQQTWDMPHLSSDRIADLVQRQLNFAACLDWLTAELPLPSFLATVPANLPLWFASVIPAQTVLWRQYQQAEELMKKAGYTQLMMIKDETRGFHKLVVGPLTSQEEAEKLLAELTEKKIPGLVVSIKK